ncbi:MAG TPA: hypothetical protein VGV06_02520, partial [Methylomirabilota bacterium]|nr:hypothetical protein [Methylomirabilota bacterium]
GTSLFFPGGYLLVLFAPGYTWWFTIGMVFVTHFVVVMFFGGLLYGSVAGLRDRRRHQGRLERLRKSPEVFDASTSLSEVERVLLARLRPMLKDASVEELRPLAEWGGGRVALAAFSALPPLRPANSLRARLRTTAV